MIFNFQFSFICGLTLLHFQLTSQQQNDGSTPGNDTDHYTQLKNYLFANGRISTSKRPVTNHNTTLNVKGLLVILQIVDLEERTGSLTARGWGEFSWKDELLQWNPADYGGLEMIEIPDRTVWKPDLTILNSVDTMTTFKYAQSLIIVTSKGTAYWSPPFSSRSSCPMDHRNFPFDEHVCDIDIGSWTYHSKLLNFSHYSEFHSEEKTLQSLRVPNSMWEMTLLPTTTDMIAFECCPDYVYPYVRQSMALKRRSPLYKISFVAPTVMSVVLTLAIFWLPIDQRDRLLLSGLAIVVQLIILMRLRFTIPAGGITVPHIMLFCGNSFIMACLTIPITILLRRLRTRQSYMPLPSAIKDILHGVLGKILCLNTGDIQEDGNVLSERKAGSGEATVESGTVTAAKSTQSTDMILLADAINNICFFLYCLSFFIIIVVSFA
ncbi:hypothetical protein CHUAL_005785 [Chamberlinius hualienensis]